MLSEMVFLQSFGYYGGGTFGNILSRLGQLGFFDYVLPFLIIFSLVFGILTKTNIFKENKGINAIIALAVGLMALQFNTVTIFFSELFPRLGVGLAIILTIMVLAGLFLDTEGQGLNYLLLAVSGIIVIIVLASTAEASSWWYSWSFYSGNIGEILLIVGIIAVMVAVVVTANAKTQEKYKPVWMKGD
ncbi:hypothetical protein COU59_03815 [Candidatus Pacearchaeota archaeon CG10_big_fil_rev_8_21_14_0_10_34_12]|nr:MAG: hypothetical protein COU59_03815 [Candidatus Pacearchaeota archaeon CG10_big_fil_rev_8_21_14_0_10_34_12]